MELYVLWVEMKVTSKAIVTFIVGMIMWRVLFLSVLCYMSKPSTQIFILALLFLLFFSLPFPRLSHIHRAVSQLLTLIYRNCSTFLNIENGNCC